jgi:hypothetical protein
VSHPIFSEIQPYRDDSKVGILKSIYKGKYKFILSRNGNHQLFDLALDPGEKSDLYSRWNSIARKLKKEISEFVDQLPAPPSSGQALSVDEQTVERLKSLGYL